MHIFVYVFSSSLLDFDFRRELPHALDMGIIIPPDSIGILDE